MSEPLHSEPSRAADALSGADRDARVEQLLLQGLDHYFACDYEQAIHVWTRVLFLDRGQTRARAYIERARNALSERQRESEEILHRGVAAFDRGDTSDARRLLNAAVQKGIAPDVALSYLGRLDRLTPHGSADPTDDAGATNRDTRQADREHAPDRRRWRLQVAAGLLAFGVQAVRLAPSLLEIGDLREALQTSRTGPARPQPDAERVLPIVRAADAALSDARAAYRAGRPLEALRALRSIGIADPLRPEADRLRADIQRTLLAANVDPVARRGSEARR
jgi:tetratricopeptide (TPR) repeat protein